MAGIAWKRTGTLLRMLGILDKERLVDLRIEFYPTFDGLARESLPLTHIYFLTPRGW